MPSHQKRANKPSSRRIAEIAAQMNSSSSSASDAPIALSSQVGGHAGVMSSTDGALIIKPCLPFEKDFYTALGRGTDEDSAEEEEKGDIVKGPFDALRPWVARFYGTLRLEGKVVVVEGEPSTQEGSERPAAPGNDNSAPSTVTTVEPLPGVGEKDESCWNSLVLENLAHAFHQANIMDVKLGTILWDRDASAEKRERMEKTAHDTTSFETGVRLVGFQVYDNENKAFIHVEKTYGKSLKTIDLPAGIARFFPIAPAAPSSSSTGGVSARLLLRVLEGVAGQLRAIEHAVANTEMRMVGGSLLIVWEGDAEVLEAALEKADLGEEDTEESGGETSESGSGERLKKIGPPYLVRLIDFAHTHAVPGQGPDEGVVKGIKTTLGLVERRIREVKGTIA